jgi:hypothetical protein
VAEVCGQKAPLVRQKKYGSIETARKQPVSCVHALILLISQSKLNT